MKLATIQNRIRNSCTENENPRLKLTPIQYTNFQTRNSGRKDILHLTLGNLSYRIYEKDF